MNPDKNIETIGKIVSQQIGNFITDSIKGDAKKLVNGGEFIFYHYHPILNELIWQGASKEAQEIIGLYTNLAENNPTFERQLLVMPRFKVEDWKKIKNLIYVKTIEIEDSDIIMICNDCNVTDRKIKIETNKDNFKNFWSKIKELGYNLICLEVNNNKNIIECLTDEIKKYQCDILDFIKLKSFWAEYTEIIKANYRFNYIENGIKNSKRGKILKIFLVPGVIIPSLLTGNPDFFSYSENNIMHHGSANIELDELLMMQSAFIFPVYHSIKKENSGNRNSILKRLQSNEYSEIFYGVFLFTYPYTFFSFNIVDKKCETCKIFKGIENKEARSILKDKCHCFHNFSIDINLTIKFIDEQIETESEEKDNIVSIFRKVMWKALCLKNDAIKKYINEFNKSKIEKLYRDFIDVKSKIFSDSSLKNTKCQENECRYLNRPKEEAFKKIENILKTELPVLYKKFKLDFEKSDLNKAIFISKEFARESLESNIKDFDDRFDRNVVEKIKKMYFDILDQTQNYFDNHKDFYNELRRIWTLIRTLEYGGKDCFTAVAEEMAEISAVGDYISSLGRFEEVLMNIPKYREHIVHMYQVYLLGFLILSNKEMEAVLENKNIFLPKDIKVQALWRTISTSHDIAYPIEKFNEWVEKFVEKFKIDPDHLTINLSVHNLLFNRNSADQLAYLLNFLENRESEKEKNKNFLTLIHWYLFIKKDHAILSALFVSHLINEIYNDICNKNCLENLSKGYRTFINQILKLNEKFEISVISNQNSRNSLNQNVETISSAILLHNYFQWPRESSSKHRNYNFSRENQSINFDKIPKISFDKQPYIFLLALCDLLQEKGRPSGDEMYKKKVKSEKPYFRSFLELTEIKFDTNSKELIFKVQTQINNLSDYDLQELLKMKLITEKDDIKNKNYLADNIIHSINIESEDLNYKIKYYSENESKFKYVENSKINNTGNECIYLNLIEDPIEEILKKYQSINSFANIFTSNNEIKFTILLPSISNGTYLKKITIGE